MAAANAYKGDDHALRTILGLKGKAGADRRAERPDGDEFIQDRLTTHVNAEGRIVDLVYG